MDVLKKEENRSKGFTQIVFWDLPYIHYYLFSINPKVISIKKPQLKIVNFRIERQDIL